MPEVVAKIGLRPPLSDGVSQIWPVRERFTLWPPDITISDRHADNLAGAIATIMDYIGSS